MTFNHMHRVVKFNGNDCETPGPIMFTLNSQDMGNGHTALGETLVGHCNDLSAGKYVVTVVKGTVPGRTEGSSSLGSGVKLQWKFLKQELLLTRTPVLTLGLATRATCRL